MLQIIKKEKGFRVITDDVELSKKLFAELEKSVRAMGLEFSAQTITVRQSKIDLAKNRVGRQAGVFKEPTPKQIENLEKLLNRNIFQHKMLYKVSGLSDNGFRNWLKRNPKYANWIETNRKNKRNGVVVPIIESVVGLKQITMSL